MHPHEIIANRLKQMGIAKIEVSHFRKSLLNNGFFTKNEFKNQNALHCVSATGGYTIVEAKFNGRLFKAEANCSNQDHFIRRQGLTIALRRLYKDIVSSSRIQTAN